MPRPMSSTPISRPSPEGRTDEAIIVVKAAPQLSSRHGETVCTAGITRGGQWVRLFPIAFRTLEEAQQFKRWDVVSYSWQLPRDDRRGESRRVQHRSLTVVASFPKDQRFGLITPMVKESLEHESTAGRSLAFIRPAIRKFMIEKKHSDEIAQEREKFDTAAKQTDLFLAPILPYQPCPYRFRYEYDSKDGRRTGTCQDWETEATFFYWRKQHSEAEALNRMQARWGEEMPTRGLLFAMGTHSLYPNVWLINGLIQMAEFGQLTLELDGPGGQ